MERLKVSKAAVAANIKARAATKLELPETAESAAKFVAPTALASAPVVATAPTEPVRESLAADAAPADYTSRLLAAKERARRERERPE
jgi:hypothetical protein